MKKLLRILFQIRVQNRHQFGILVRARVKFEQLLEFSLGFAVVTSSKARCVATKDERGNVALNTKHRGRALLVDLMNELPICAV